MVAVTMPQPTYRNTLYSCLYLLSIKSMPTVQSDSPGRVTCACFNANHPQICPPVAKEIVACSALVFSEARIQFCVSC